MRRNISSLGYVGLLFILALAIFRSPTPVLAQSPAPACDGVVEIPAGECAALLDLYTGTAGSNWTYHANWFETGIPPSAWYGVTVTTGHVTRLMLHGNNLAGALPASLNNLTSATELDFSTNNLSGSIPGLGSLTQLTHLLLQENNLSGTVPAFLGSLTNLKFLDLSHNLLTGSIPGELNALPNLLTLYISDNQLEGSIPPLNNLIRLQRVNLSRNRLTGAIATQFSASADLEWLILFENQLSGTSLPAFESLTRLNRIEINNNSNLSGRLPDQWGALSNLTTLIVSNTRLTGEIPASFIQLTLLERFIFSGTSICEPNSQEFSNWKAGVYAWVSTGYLCSYPHGIDVNGRVTGRGGTPLAGVTISTISPDGATVTAISNAVGDYQILVAKTGVYKLTPSSPGYLFYPATLTVQVTRSRHEQNFLYHAVNCYSPGVPTGQPCTALTSAPFLSLPVEVSAGSTDRALQDVDFPGGLITSWFNHSALNASGIELHDGETYSGGLASGLLHGVACFNRHCSTDLMGIGIAPPPGSTSTPIQIYPAAPGTVLEICDPGIRGNCDRDPSLGRYVVLMHPDLPYATLYAHLAAIPAGLATGNPVTLATQIGTMGGSGGKPLDENYWTRQLYFQVFFNGVNASPWTPDPAEAVDPFGWRPFDERLDHWTMPSVPLWSDAHPTLSEAPDVDGATLTSDGVSLAISPDVLQIGQILTLADSSLGTLLDAGLRSVGRSFHVKIFDSQNGWALLQNPQPSLGIEARVNFNPADLNHVNPNEVSLYQLDSQTWTRIPTFLESQTAVATINPSGKYALAAPLLCPQDANEPYDDRPDSYKRGFVWNGNLPLTRVFDSPGDQDFIAVEMIAGATYIFSSQHGAGIDSVLSLFAPDGRSLLVTDPKTGGSGTSQIEWKALETGTYYLRVSQAAGSNPHCDAYQILQQDTEKYIFLPFLHR